MNQIRISIAMICLMLLAGLPTLHAQVTTSTIIGTVLDESGEALIGANVVAIHEPSGSQYGVTTRDGGRFTLPNLRVGGPYTVQSSYVGYETQTFNNIELALAQKLNLDFELKNEAVELEGVVVVADSDPILNGERTGASTNIGSTELTRLPTISRSASDYYRLTPSASGNSFGGRNDQFNNFSLDGSIFNNPFGLDAATPGGQTSAQPVSLDAIEQIQVSLAPFDVRQAGFTGAAINAVTKSGTNDFSGTVFGFYRNQDLTGAKVDGQDIIVPDLTQFQAGFSLGGPLIKDKLFFFVNAEIERREDLGSNFIAAAPGRSGENVSRVEEADLVAVRNALNSVGYETGAYEGYLHDTDNEKGIFKLDWNINNSHSLTATYNFLNASKDNPAHPNALGRRGPDATTLQFENSGYQINNVLHSGIVELKSIFGNKFANNLQVGFSSFRDSRDPFSAPAPVMNINRDGIRYIVAGHEPFSIHNRLDQNVYQLTENFSIYAGNHNLTIGTSFERFEFDNSFNLGVYDPFVGFPGGSFGPGFESVNAFLDSVAVGVVASAIAGAEGLFNANGGDDGVEGEGWALAETNVGQWALYLQDEWALTNNFNLTLGIRMDMPLYFDTSDKIQENIDRNCCFVPDVPYFDEDGNSIVFDHLQLPKSTPLFSPRVGFNWDIGGTNTAQLRGGTGLFTGRFPFVWVGNHVANPNIFFYNVTHPDFQYPQVWRTNLGYDRKFNGGWTFTTDLIYTKDINAMMVRNYGIKPPTGRLGSEVDSRLIYGDADQVGNAAYVFTNTDVGRSLNVSVELKRNWANGLYTSIGYNYLDAQDASSIEAEISSDAYDRNPAFGNVNKAVLAPSIYGNRHRIVGSAHKRFEYGEGTWATTFALFFEYAEGNRFTYTYSGDINRDASGLNDLIYIPTQADLEKMPFSTLSATEAQQRTALNAFIEQDEYLSGRRGDYAEKYGILSPWYSTWDLRILQDLNLKVGERTNTIQLSIDILNVGNLISSSWGVRQFPVNTQPIGVSLDENNIPTYSFDTNLKTSFSNDFSLLSRWQMQFGLRYRF